MYGWTPVLSLSVMLLLPVVYWCRYAMQRDVYVTPSSGDGVGICSFAFKAIHSKTAVSRCYNKWSVGYFGLKLHRHILGTPKTNITSCKKGHNRCLLMDGTLKGTSHPINRNKHCALVLLIWNKVSDFNLCPLYCSIQTINAVLALFNVEWQIAVVPRSTDARGLIISSTLIPASAQNKHD